VATAQGGRVPGIASIDEVLAEVLTPGQDIVIGQGSGAPAALVAALPRHLDALQGSRLLIGWVLGDFPDLPGVEITTFFPSGRFGSRDGLAAAGALYQRCSLHALASDLHTGARPVDVALAQASRAAAGRHSLGWTVDYVSAAVDRATAVVLEVGDQVPWTGPRTLVPTEADVRLVATSGRPLPQLAQPAVRGRLGEHVAAWIPDGATIELGLGRWVAQVTTALAHRRGLRIHSGLIGDWVLALGRNGALDRGLPIVGTAATASATLHAALADSPFLDLAPAYLTHAPDVLAALPTFRAVNSVLEVDLLGRANSEVGSGGRIGGIGGLADFAAGAAANPDGLSIIALNATAGTRSRIVPRLADDRMSLTAEHVDVVVTEHGSADLRGVPPAQRARLLIDIAAPEHRSPLAKSLQHHNIQL
jgi:acyl-CoA hydrolase